MNSTLCNSASETLWLQCIVAVLLYVTKFGAISRTCTVEVASETDNDVLFNRENVPRGHHEYRITLENSF